LSCSSASGRRSLLDGRSTWTYLTAQSVNSGERSREWTRRVSFVDALSRSVIQGPADNAPQQKTSQKPAQTMHRGYCRFDYFARIVVSGMSQGTSRRLVWREVFERNQLEGGVMRKCNRAFGGSCALRTWLLASASVGVGVPGTLAFAQSQDIVATVQRLEEVVVTATRREVSAQDVPISMTVLSGSDMEQKRVISLDDVTKLVPGVIYVPNSGAEGYISIRGAETLDDSTGTDQSVALFVDDVSATSVADFDRDLFDIDHVEVLKGPQGTFFGRNAANGVVSIYTRQPTFTSESKAELTYGNYNLVEAKGMVNTPIVADTVAARFTVTAHARDAYIADPILDDHLGYQNRWAATGKLLFTPSQSLKAVLAFDYLYEKNSSATWILGNFQPMLDPGLSYSTAQSNQGILGYQDARRWGLSGRIDWTSGIGTLTSITGYRNVYAVSGNSITADPPNIAVSYIHEQDKQFTEELRLASPSDRRLTWVAGLYYLHSDRDRPTPIDFNVIPGTLLSFAVTTPQFIAVIDQNTTTTSAAGFGDATYAFVDELKLSLGGRYTYEKKSGSSFINPGTVISGPAIGAVYSNSWSAFTPRVALTYQPNQELMAYATFSEGFQSGGYNVQGSTEQALNTPFAPENVYNYEVGAKWDGWGHRLQANLAAFLQRTKNLQVVQYVGQTLSFQTTNAGEAEVKGVEAEINAAVAPPLTLGVAYTYLHGRFTDYVINNGPGVPETDYTGNKIPYTPMQSVTATVDLHFDVAPLRGRLSLRADYTYRSEYELDAANDIPQFIRDETAWHGLVNAYAGWTRQDGRWEVRLWGKNITNIRYTTFGADTTPYYESLAEFNNPANSIFLMTPNAVRSFGITVDWKM
jgi:iron complex outermembrane recepter protein